jgi:hypothetical protein
MNAPTLAALRVEIPEAIDLLVYHPAYQALVAFSLLILVRRALMRLEDIDVDQR